MKRSLLLALLALALAACDGVSDGVSIGPAVFGVAYDAATNEPLDGVRVDVSHRSGLSNPRGSYYISQVPKGVHTLTASKEGYAPFTVDVNVNESMIEKKLFLAKK